MAKVTRCAMCFLERDPAKMRGVIPELPIKVCGRCSMDLDRARGFLEMLGVVLQFKMLAPVDLAVNGRSRGPKKPRNRRERVPAEVQVPSTS